MFRISSKTPGDLEVVELDITALRTRIERDGKPLRRLCAGHSSLHQLESALARLEWYLTMGARFTGIVHRSTP